ncbi:ankyrin repeat and fibronectin type-III domain-containing protein 1 [Trichonephila clavata]|uniref:Ankyrin repeat and fibronectin type-III domain-containing protein 1 n=1 Tax=Trichonephila clavata TaxID=2740835 RepID=A0A8X6HSE1_TRICU|nr:ankyrin repeat and fibronectin type-III domain-containing protein 1 [Trichonephila clavata]
MDVSGRKSRSLGRLCQLDCVFHQIIFSRPPYSSEIKDIIFGNTLETPQQQRRQVRKSIKSLFTPTPKFQKNMKRGVYLACLMYTDHRVLVTTEDTLPVMEVDDSCPSCLHNDFHWLMKVACTWEDAKVLRTEMEKTQSSSAIHFRSKLLQAADMMQNALGVQDLGQFYYKPIKDLDDTTVLCTVKHVPDSKSLNNLSLRWVPLAKLQRKLSINNETCHDAFTVNSLLLSATQAMMAYNHMSRIPLPKGLYVAYVKISSSVDLIRVLVPKKAPNVLPYYKVRENPHVSAEEWEWLKCLSSGEKGSASAAQFKFQKALSSAMRNLLILLEVQSENTGEHRIYDKEVIELNSEVSLILLLPPVDSVCSAPGQKDDVTERSDCVLLPLQIFEMIHMSTYQHTFISRYSRISSILEMDTLVAQHIHRQAFSTTELASAKSRLRQLQQFQTQVDNTWRSMRWLMDVLNFAREKQGGGLLLKNFLVEKADSPSTTPPQSPQHSQSLHTLQVPSEVPGLRSFPGPIPPVSIRITNSSSSFSLTEPKNHSDDTLKPNAEMRRCASTSRLLLASNSTDETDSESYSRQKPPSTLELMDDKSKAYSAETLSVTYKLGSCGNARCDTSATNTPVNEDEECSEKCQGNDNTLSHEGIIINVIPGRGSSHSLSSTEATNPEIDDFEDDISDYKEQQMDELLHLPHDDSKDHPSDDEDSLTDCGLQFKAISSSEEALPDRDDEDYAFITSVLDSELSCPDINVDISVDELKVSVAYHDNIPSDTCVRLRVNPDATAKEIVEAIIGQMNEAILSGQYDSELYVSDQIKDMICLVVSFGTVERFLSDSFQPLKVQNPWTKGQLIAKRKPDTSTSQPEQ